MVNFMLFLFNVLMVFVWVFGGIALESHNVFSSHASSAFFGAVVGIVWMVGVMKLCGKI